MNRRVACCCMVALLLGQAARAEPAGEAAPWAMPGLAPAELPAPCPPPAPACLPCDPVPPAPSPLLAPAAHAGPDRLAVLEQKLGGLAQRFTVFTADEDWKLVLFGAVQGTMIFSTARPVAPGTPLFLAPGPVPGFEQQTVDVHARASFLAAALAGPKLGDWQTGGLIVAFFYNDNLIADRYGILPFQIWGDLKNEDWRFAAGLQRDIFNPVDPTMLAFSFLFGSGNTGNFRGQFRVERFLRPTDDSQVTVQLGLSEPIATIVSDALRISEDNGWPNVEARVALGLGPVEGQGPLARRAVEVGLSGVVGQVRTSDPLAGRQVVADVLGVGVDARWRVTDRFGVQGELYAGQALGTYNGGVLQNVNSATFEAIRTAGGWGEVYYYLYPERLHAHLGVGVDDPLDRDVAPAQVLRNQTYFANLIWDVTKAFRLGFEFTWRETAYRLLRDNEGATFQTVAQWSF